MNTVGHGWRRTDKIPKHETIMGEFGWSNVLMEGCPTLFSNIRHCLKADIFLTLSKKTDRLSRKSIGRMAVPVNGRAVYEVYAWRHGIRNHGARCPQRVNRSNTVCGLHAALIDKLPGRLVCQTVATDHRAPSTSECDCELDGQCWICQRLGGFTLLWNIADAPLKTIRTARGSHVNPRGPRARLLFNTRTKAR